MLNVLHQALLGNVFHQPATHAWDILPDSNGIELDIVILQIVRQDLRWVAYYIYLTKKENRENYIFQTSNCFKKKNKDTPPGISENHIFPDCAQTYGLCFKVQMTIKSKYDIYTCPCRDNDGSAPTWTLGQKKKRWFVQFPKY